MRKYDRQLELLKLALLVVVVMTIILAFGGCGASLQELQEDCLERDLRCEEAVRAEDRVRKKRQRKDREQAMIEYCHSQDAFLVCEHRGPGPTDYENDRCYCQRYRW